MNMPLALDLHGLTIQQGFNKALMFTKVHKMQGTPNIKIITGLSGKMHKEFPEWMKSPAFKPLIKNFNQAVERGAFNVKL